MYNMQYRNSQYRKVGGVAKVMFSSYSEMRNAMGDVVVGPVVECNENIWEPHET